MHEVKILTILAVCLSIFSSPVLTRKPAIREHYYGNWYLEHVIPHELRLNENFNRHRDFGFVSCYYGRRTPYCNVTVLHANLTDYRKKSCGALDDFKPHVDHVSTLLVPDDIRERDRVAILWSSQKSDQQKIKVTYVNMTNCQRNDTGWMPVKHSSRFSRLLQYPYPAFVATFVNDTNQTGLLGFSLDDNKPIANVLTPLNHSYYNIFKEAPNVVNLYPGLFFIYMNRTETSVMYTNLTTNTAKKIGVAHDHYQEISGTNNKYGVCWRNYHQINCTQYDVYGHKLLNGTTIKLSQHFDWWKVYNLKESAMLLITGQYHRGKCAKFNVTKIQAGGMKSSSVEIDSLSVECPHKGDLVDVTVSEDTDRKLICFNFVIETTKYKWHDLVHLQYRRLCIDQDYVKEMM